MKFDITVYTDVWPGDYTGEWYVNNCSHLDGKFEIPGDPEDSEIIEFLINKGLIAEEDRGNINVNDGFADVIEIELNSHDDFPLMRLELL